MSRGWKSKASIGGKPRELLVESLFFRPMPCV